MSADVLIVAVLRRPQNALPKNIFGSNDKKKFIERTKFYSLEEQNSIKINRILF